VTPVRARDDEAHCPPDGDQPDLVRQPDPRLRLEGDPRGQRAQEEGRRRGEVPQGPDRAADAVRESMGTWSEDSRKEFWWEREWRLLLSSRASVSFTAAETPPWMGERTVLRPASGNIDCGSAADRAVLDQRARANNHAANRSEGVGGGCSRNSSTPGASALSAKTLAIPFKAGAPRRHHRRGALDPRVPFQLSSAGGMWWLPLNRSLGS
jgi:hypothetical protein